MRGWHCIGKQSTSHPPTPTPTPTSEQSILLSDLLSGLAGFLVATAAIVLLGEILPQALCSRSALKMGARAVPLVRMYMDWAWLGLVDAADQTEAIITPIHPIQTHR